MKLRWARLVVGILMALAFVVCGAILVVGGKQSIDVYALPYAVPAALIVVALACLLSSVWVTILVILRASYSPWMTIGVVLMTSGMLLVALEGVWSPHWSEIILLTTWLVGSTVDRILLQLQVSTRWAVQPS
jgi:hypothetical protein